MVVSLRFNFRPFRLWAMDASNSLTTKSHLRPAGTLKGQGRYAIDSLRLDHSISSADRPIDVDPKILHLRLLETNRDLIMVQRVYVNDDLSCQPLRGYDCRVRAAYARSLGFRTRMGVGANDRQEARVMYLLSPAAIAGCHQSDENVR